MTNAAVDTNDRMLGALNMTEAREGHWADFDYGNHSFLLTKPTLDFDRTRIDSALWTNDGSGTRDWYRISSPFIIRVMFAALCLSIVPAVLHPPVDQYFHHWRRANG